ncbi:MAG TPA: potassium channel family protein [Tepidisphaeraceae bacterium]|jgi:hypothetical protein
MTWKEQLNEGLAAFGVRIPDELPIDQWATRLGDNPCRNTAALVTLSSLLFYAAERDHNPKVNDVFDAAVYCSTCLSVGYGDIFARTPLGKLLGTALMTIGPSLSGAALDGPAAERRDATQEQILATLKQILERLPANGAESGADQPATVTDQTGRE